MNRRSSLSDQLKMFRRVKDVSEATVGKAIGKSRSAYAAYEDERSTPNPETLKSLCRFFGVTPNELLEWDNE